MREYFRHKTDTPVYLPETFMARGKPWTNSWRIKIFNCNLTFFIYCLLKESCYSLLTILILVTPQKTRNTMRTCMKGNRRVRKTKGYVEGRPGLGFSQRQHWQRSRQVTRMTLPWPVAVST